MTDHFVKMDIYLIDQILKGRFDPGHRVIDLGCGGGRNLRFFLKNGYPVFGLDKDPAAIAKTLQLAQQWQPGIEPSQFKVGTVEDNDFSPGSFDLVICNAVLHFAESKRHFEQILFSACKLLRPGGFFFSRLASDIGLEDRVLAKGNGRYDLPDGSERFLVNEAMLLYYTQVLNAQLAEPIKTTNVQNQRCMTTWCMVVG